MTASKKPVKKSAEKKSTTALAKNTTKTSTPNVHPLSPLTDLVCPRCREEFGSYQLNKTQACEKCGQGFFVTKARHEFFVLP